MASPALPPMRPGLMDPSRPAEFSVLLGESLLHEKNNDGDQLLNVRYNWKSKQISQRQVITQSRQSSGSYKLAVREDSSEPYKYSGTVDPSTTNVESACLALVFDKERAVFTLESMPQTLNFNLTSATTKSNIDQLPQLETAVSNIENPTQLHNRNQFPTGEQSVADAENPYDYRHFLADARKEAEAGSSTPKPLTPAIGSPRVGAPKVRTATNQVTRLRSPFMGPSTRKKTEAKPASRGVVKTSNTWLSAPDAKKTKENGKTARGTARKKLAEKAAPSYEEEDDEPSRNRSKDNSDGSNSRTYMPSPNIIVDEASDLTIDMGSPPPTARFKHRINPDAFSSNSRGQSRANTASTSPETNRAELESDRDAEGDVGMDDGNEDDDIEDLALPSPRATRAPSHPLNRLTQEAGMDEAEEDDEDDGLAAELEAVFDEDDELDGNTLGLGISAGQQSIHRHDEEESEESEEE